MPISIDTHRFTLYYWELFVVCYFYNSLQAFITFNSMFATTVDRKPGDIEGITDIFFEDFKNFPQTRELGEESAQFVREEMEKTWGNSRLAVLSEDEAQQWILGVSCTLYSWTHAIPIVSPHLVLSSLP